MKSGGGGATRKSAPDGNLIRYNSIITPKVILNKFQNLMTRRYAFTLAEVLITLGIIGIVAAMTLPSLIGNYQKKQTAMQLKKVYSLMQQALQRAEVDYEAFEYWDFTLSGSDFSDRYIKPYYKIITDYDKTDFPDEYHTTCNQGGNCDGYGTFSTTSKIILTDGTLLAINHSSTRAEQATHFMTIITDLNGFKKPNKYGRDIFMFSIQPERGVMPYGVGNLAGEEQTDKYDRYYLLNGGLRGCNKDGIFCAALIMMDGWEIKDDYPW